ncbi:MAG TPA: hypothetical protein VEG34_06495, partial [Thermoanaerobaculia bacterium]|nr:hypothetical protein [Thermoanaerobaculia bacterium]
IPKEFSLIDAERYIAVLETSFEATRLYRRELSYDSRIVVFKGDDSFEFGEDLGWGVAAPHVETHVVPGGHRTMFESPNVEVLGDLLKECFDRYDPISGGDDD